MFSSAQGGIATSLLGVEPGDLGSRFSSWKVRRTLEDTREGRFWGGGFHRCSVKALLCFVHGLLRYIQICFDRHAGDKGVPGAVDPGLLISGVWVLGVWTHGFRGIRGAFGHTHFGRGFRHTGISTCILDMVFDTRTSRPAGVWIYGHWSIGTFGRLDTWAFGHMGIWTHGRLDTPGIVALGGICTHGHFDMQALGRLGWACKDSRTSQSGIWAEASSPSS